MSEPAERVVVLQYVVNQRTERPTGLRVWSDGQVQRCAADNPLPTPTERLDVDRAVQWNDDRRLSADQLDALKATIRQSGLFGLPPRLLINYCKEDPGAAIWTANLDGQHARVVIYDPRPRRSPELDALLASLEAILVKGK